MERDLLTLTLRRYTMPMIGSLEYNDLAWTQAGMERQREILCANGREGQLQGYLLTGLVPIEDTEHGDVVWMTPAPVAKAGSSTVAASMVDTVCGSTLDTMCMRDDCEYCVTSLEWSMVAAR